MAHDASTTRVHELVATIRRRWRRRALVQGAAATLLLLLFGATLWLLLYTLVPAPPNVRIAVVVATGLALIVMVGWTIIRPLLQKVSDAEIALYVEERLPELEDRLNSAVEVSTAASLPAEHAALVSRLVDDAAGRTRGIAPGAVVDHRLEKGLLLAAGVALVLFLVFGFSVRDQLVFTEGGADLAALGALAPPLLTVQPGHAEVERGASQEVVVTAREDYEVPMILTYKEGDGGWQQAEMQAGAGEETAFLFEFFAIQEPIDYYVTYGEARTEPFAITLYTFPAVEQIDLTYRLPDYTGLPARTDTDTGDIRGLKGSTVTVDVRASGTLETAELVLDDGQTVALNATSDSTYQGVLALQEPGFYTVRLTDAQGKANKFPVEYRIEPVDDLKPTVAITDPQRDVRANAIEEVFVAATASDDYGVQALRLRYSVNGEAEETVDLSADAPALDLEGEHLFFLEDYAFQPGDVISYYVEAEDAFYETPTATDMYFIEVVPFDQDYRQAANQGGMGGGQPGGLVLSQQDIIAATWRLLREAPELDAAEVDEARDALVQAQATLRQEIEERISSTAFSLELRANESHMATVEHLRQATASMSRAVEVLRSGDLRAALAPERQALTHLRRAEAQNRENQIARGQGQGGGGGATEERMTELMDLELDISKDKYETQQQRGQQQPQGPTDETMEKLRDLARRQQNLANTNRPNELEDEERKRFIDRLQRDQEELRQQAEDLAQNLRQQQGQQRGDPSQRRQGRAAQEQLERIADDMRQAERELERGDLDASMRRQQQALNRIEDLQRDLRSASPEGTQAQSEALARQFDELREQEQQLARNLARTAESARAGDAPDRDALERLQQQRAATQEGLEQLTEEAEALEERLRGEDAETAQALREALTQMRRDRLEEAMDASEQALEQGWIDRAERLEGDILYALDNLETMRQAAEQALPPAEDEQLARALDEVRDLERQLQEMRQQAGSPEGDQQGQASSDSPSGGRAQAARQQRQLQDAQRTLERLQRELGGNESIGRPVRELQRNLGRADHTGIRLGEDTDFFDDDVFEALSQLETELARRLDIVEMEKKLFGGRRPDVPAEYRELVERYYQELSKQGSR